MRDDKSNRDELREREVREATLPFETTILPSWSRGEPGINELAAPTTPLLPTPLPPLPAPFGDVSENKKTPF